MLPLEVPGVSTALNRYLVARAGMQHVSLYRIYVLREREQRRRRAGGGPASRVVVPTRNEAGNVAAAIARTPVMGDGHRADLRRGTLQRRHLGRDPAALRATTGR